MDEYQFSYPSYLKQYFHESHADQLCISILKFASGSLLIIFLIIVLAYANDFDNTKEKIHSLGFLIIIGVSSGFINYCLPTFLYKELNYIIGVLIQIIFVTSIFLKFSQLNSIQDQSKN